MNAKPETRVVPLTESERKEAEPVIRLALALAKHFRELAPEEQRQWLADTEQDIAQCPNPRVRAALEAMKEYVARACLH